MTQYFREVTLPGWERAFRVVFGCICALFPLLFFLPAIVVYAEQGTSKLFYGATLGVVLGAYGLYLCGRYVMSGIRGTRRERKKAQLPQELAATSSLRPYSLHAATESNRELQRPVTHMMFSPTTRAVLSAIVFIAVLVLGIGLLPASKCNDGWASSSIGKQGACSHHGGVNRNTPLRLLVIAVAIGASFFAYSGLARNAPQRSPQPRSTNVGHDPRPNSSKRSMPRSDEREPAIIRDAIDNELTLHFCYQKSGSAEIEERHIRPQGFKTVQHTHGHRGGSSLCVYGYCFDRRTKRSFAIKKMSDIYYGSDAPDE